MMDLIERTLLQLEEHRPGANSSSGSMPSRIPPRSIRQDGMVAWDGASASVSGQSCSAEHEATLARYDA
jgi:hypothetical protein